MDRPRLFLSAVSRALGGDIQTVSSVTEGKIRVHLEESIQQAYDAAITAAEEGVDQTIAYVETQREAIFASFRAATKEIQKRNRMKLQPLLQTAALRANRDQADKACAHRLSARLTEQQAYLARGRDIC